MSDAPELRVVMVTADIEGDIEQGLDLANEPTVILQGPVEAVREAARMFGEAVKVAPVSAPDPALFAELVEALRGLIAHTHNCERELTEELHHADFCGESKPLTDARTILAKIGGDA